MLRPINYKDNQSTKLNEATLLAKNTATTLQNEDTF